MKNKILSVLVCVCMLMAFLPQGLWAQGTQLNFERFFSGTTGDWEIYADNTNLVVIVTGEECPRIAQSIDEGTLTWYLKTNGVSYQVNPGSYYLYPANDRIILRFPTFSHGFCPAVNPIERYENAGIYYNIDFSALDKDGNEIYYGSIYGLHSDITDPEVPGVETLNGSRYGSGMRVYEGYVTQITFTIKESIVQELYDSRDEYEWMLSISDGSTFYYGRMYPTSCEADKYLVTFEPCLAEKPFIPKKNVLYYINLELWQNDTMKYFAGSTIYGYRLEEDPVLGGEKYDVTFRAGDTEETKSWYEGQTPYYAGTPVKVSDSPAYNYVFSGWEPKIEKVTGDTVYTALFEKVPATYDVTFVTDMGSLTQTLTYGEMPQFEGDLAGKSEGDTIRLFTHWDKEFEPVSRDTVYTALYDTVAKDNVLTVNVEGGTLYRGTQKSFTFSLDNCRQITQLSFDFHYDESRYVLVSVVPLVKGLTVSGTRVAYSGSALPGKADLFTVTLAAKEDADFGRSVLGITNGYFLQAQKRRGYQASGATLMLGQPLSGDIDHDTAVTVSDASSLLTQLVQKSGIADDVGDTNCDGKIDLRDAVRICAYLDGSVKEIYSVYDQTKYTVTYVAQKGGEVIGKTKQTLTRKQMGEAVYAYSYVKNYRFVGWSDGKEGIRRQDSGIEGNVTIVARFVESPIVLDMPEIHINTWDGSGVTSNTEYKNGTLSILGADKEAYNVSDLALEIKGRGNYLWSVLWDSKPSYRLRLAKKADLLGLGKERDFVLITTYSDVSMLRQYMTWRLGEIFDNLPHSVKGEYVSLYVNGDYLGVYLLCERIEASRLGLEDEEEKLDKDYLLELDGRAAGEGKEGLDWFTVEGGQQPFVIKSQVNNSNETAYIQKMVSMMNEALLSGEASRVAAFVNVDSLVDSYIIQEFGKDRDVGYASFFLYKKAGGQFYFTTPWDFDLAWGNDERHPTAEGLVSTPQDGNRWFAVLSVQDWFQELVRKRMTELTEKVMTFGSELLATGKALTTYAMQDEARWGTIGKRVFLEPESVYTLKNYEEHYQYLYDWYINRWMWLCKQFDVI